MAALFFFSSLKGIIASDIWTNGSLGDWFVPGNWSTGVPNSSAAVLIVNGGTPFIGSAGARADSIKLGAYVDPSTPAGNGTLLVNAFSGTPGTLTVRELEVGFIASSGNIFGNLNIAAGAAVHVTGLTAPNGYGAIIGENDAGGPVAGTVDVTGAGSLFDVQAGQIVMGVGTNSTGTLVVENGAHAQNLGTILGNGSITVKGAGSVWHSGAYLRTSAGSTVAIQSGGFADTSVVQLFDGIIQVENGSLTVSGLTVSGAHTEFSANNSGSLVVGDTTTGRMEIRNGGAVIGFRGYMGGNAGGMGSVLITDVSSKWKTDGSLWVGNAGSGTLEILNGGTAMTGGNGYLAFSNNTSGIATIDGTSSKWTITGSLLIGGNGAGAAGSGQLIIRNGAAVTAGAITLWDTGILTLGPNGSLKGPFTAMGGVIDAADNLTFANDITLGSEGLLVRTNGFNPVFSGVLTGSGGLGKSGTFTGSGVGTLTLTGNSTYTGPTTIFFGKLQVDGSIKSAVTVNSSGILAGNGTVGGIVINSGGNVSPGNSPGILKVNGNYLQKSGGILNLELGGPNPGTGFDQVTVTGSATVDGTLKLSLVNGYRPIVGQQFVILTSSSESGNFATITSSGFMVSSAASSTGIVLTVTSVAPGVPVITSATGASGVQGQAFTYQITATDSPTSFNAAGLPPGLGVNTTTGIISGSATAIGSFDVVISATNSTGTGSATLTLTISAPAPPSTTLANISTRLRVETGDNALIGGFIVTGTQPKKVIIRALGPSVPVPGALSDPTLELYQGGTLLESNDNWVDSANKQAIIDSTIPPSNNLEAAIVRTLPANSTGYTAIVRGANNGTGIGVVEAYDLDRSVDSKLANISTRGLVQTGDNALIAGTIILGQGTQKVIVRAIGPSLPIAGALANPTMELRDQNGGLVQANDNWVDSPDKQAIIDSTIPPTNDLESAIIATLPANGASFTAIVRGVNDTTGIAVVEVYALQ